MVKELKNLKMVIYIKENIKMENLMDMESIIGLMGHYIKVYIYYYYSIIII